MQIVPVNGGFYEWLRLIDAEYKLQLGGECQSPVRYWLWLTLYSFSDHSETKEQHSRWEKKLKDAQDEIEKVLHNLNRYLTTPCEDTSMQVRIDDANKLWEQLRHQAVARVSFSHLEPREMSISTSSPLLLSTQIEAEHLPHSALRLHLLTGGISPFHLLPSDSSFSPFNAVARFRRNALSGLEGFTLQHGSPPPVPNSTPHHSRATSPEGPWTGEVAVYSTDDDVPPPRVHGRRRR